MKGILANFDNLVESDFDRLIDYSPEYPQVLQGAALYRTFSSNTEVSGKMILKMLEVSGGYQEQVQQIMQMFDLANIQPDGWYPEQQYLDALNKIMDCTSPVLLNQMGAALADMVLCISGMGMSDTGVEEGILLLNQYFHRWHQSGEPGDYRLLQSNPDLPSVMVQCRHPYPCEMDMGLLKRLVQRITRKNQVMVFHDHRQSQRCRKCGAGACYLVVSW